MKLSIITPYYKTYEYTKKLKETLEPQLNDDVEWIIVDDGCRDERLDSFNARVVHLTNNSGNASVPRNIGMFLSKGDYITFIDSDDYVLPNYIDKIFQKIDEGFDYCYISWLSTNGYVIKIKDKPPEWNNSVWKCVYRKEMIEHTKFNPDINYGEDKFFNENLPEGKTTSIDEPIYVYTTNRENSLSFMYRNGFLKYKK